MASSASRESSTAAPATPAKPYIGGQAVLEGVMMRSPTSFAVVVRRQDGSLNVRERPISDPREGYEKWPFFRGIASLVESLKLGGEALRFSSEQFEHDLAASDAAAAAASSPVLRALSTWSAVLRGVGMTLFTLATAADGESVHAPSDGSEKKKSGASFTMLAAMVLFIVLLPQAAASGVKQLLGLDGPAWELQAPRFQLLTGAFKIAIVVGYMLVIRRVPEIRRVFQYHGAEHKTISTYEAGEELRVENARKYSTLHPRCGTTFLVMVALVSVLVFTALGQVMPKIDTGNRLLDNVVFFVVKLPFVPVIASITFEIQRIFARYFTKGPLRVVLWPGFLVQKITTIEPDDRQLEIALASLRVTLFREEEKQGGTDVELARFASYEELLSSPQLRGAS